MTCDFLGFFRAAPRESFNGIDACAIVGVHVPMVHSRSGLYNTGWQTPTINLPIPASRKYQVLANEEYNEIVLGIFARPTSAVFIHLIVG